MIGDLEKRFDEIINAEKSNQISNSTKCVMQCQRDRAMVLMPCKHQPTCNPCFVLWKMHLSGQKLDTICPICKSKVTDQIAVNDD